MGTHNVHLVSADSRHGCRGGVGWNRALTESHSISPEDMRVYAPKGHCFLVDFSTDNLLIPKEKSCGTTAPLWDNSSAVGQPGGHSLDQTIKGNMSLSGTNPHAVAQEHTLGGAWEQLRGRSAPFRTATWQKENISWSQDEGNGMGSLACLLPKSQKTKVRHTFKHGVWSPGQGSGFWTRKRALVEQVETFQYG